MRHKYGITLFWGTGLRNLSDVLFKAFIHSGIIHFTYTLRNNNNNAKDILYYLYCFLLIVIYDYAKYN